MNKQDNITQSELVELNLALKRFQELYIQRIPRSARYNFSDFKLWEDRFYRINDVRCMLVDMSDDLLNGITPEER